MNDNQNQNNNQSDPMDDQYKNTLDDEKEVEETSTETPKPTTDRTDNKVQSSEHVEDTPSEQKRQPRPKKRHVGLSAIIGGVSGGLIACITVLVLISNQIISVGEPTDDTTTSESEQTESEQVISSQVSDDSEVNSSIEETTQAVVGVSSLQQKNIWEPNEETGTGSGIIYKKDGDKAYVVTNQHVVAQAEDVQVTLSDDEKVPAKVLGADELADLAILEIDGSNIDTVATLGSSDDTEVGETVIAIGNPLGMEFSNSLTKGIISGLNRSVNVDTNGDGQPDWITEVIQTDAAINPGNSGGALVNTDGEVIGINSMKVAQSAVEGIGFAIPIDTAKPIMDQLETDGQVARPFIGIVGASIEDVPVQYQENIDIPEDFDGGIVVANVEQGSPAAKAGLEQYDLITQINGEKINSFIDLRKHLYSEAEVGDTLTIEFYRNGESQETELELTERQAE